MPSVTSFATSKVRSEPSVISPYRPTPAEMRALRDELRQAQRTENWVKNEIQLPAKTQRQIMAQLTAPTAPAATVRSPATRTQPQAPTTTAQQPKKPSALKRAAVGLAVLGGIVGTIGGFISIVAIGPVGIAISGGSALLAFAAIRSLKKYDA